MTHRSLEQDGKKAKTRTNEKQQQQTLRWGGEWGDEAEQQRETFYRMGWRERGQGREYLRINFVPDTPKLRYLILSLCP